MAVDSVDCDHPSFDRPTDDVEVWVHCVHHRQKGIVGFVGKYEIISVSIRRCGCCRCCRWVVSTYSGVFVLRFYLLIFILFRQQNFGFFLLLRAYRIESTFSLLSVRVNRAGVKIEFVFCLLSAKTTKQCTQNSESIVGKATDTLLRTDEHVAQVEIDLNCPKHNKIPDNSFSLSLSVSVSLRLSASFSGECCILFFCYHPEGCFWSHNNYK